MQKKQIVQTALDILDRDGLEGVTLRRLASELNVKAASIYWHIPSKEELLDEMANAILEEGFSKLDFEYDQYEWAEWLDRLANELRAAMMAHREGARVVAGAHPDIAVMLLKLWDLTIRVLHNNGFNYAKAVTIASTVVHFTFGSVIEEQTSPPIVDLPREHRQFGGEFPAMEAAMDALQGHTSDVYFKTGMRIIINGVRVEKENQP